MEDLPGMFAHNTSVQSALGAALQAAEKLLVCQTVVCHMFLLAWVIANLCGSMHMCVLLHVLYTPYVHLVHVHYMYVHEHVCCVFIEVYSRHV